MASGRAAVALAGVLIATVSLMSMST
jgi:hypothetical protein